MLSMLPPVAELYVKGGAAEWVSLKQKALIVVLV